MADEPTLGELWRRLDDIQRANVTQNQAAVEEQRRSTELIMAQIGKLVSAEVHDRDIRRFDERHKELADDLAEERESRAKDITTERAARKELETRIQQQMDRTSLWVRWLAASVLVPVGLFIANLIQNTPS